MKKFSIHPISIIIWIWLFCVLGVKSAMSYIFVILIHEAGHYFTAKKCGYALQKFSFSPYGVSLSYNNLNYRDEILIAFAGPAVNLLSAIFVTGIWWICPATYFFTDSFVFISLVLALLNLLPAYPLDGGRIFIGLSRCFFSEKVAKRITIFTNILFSSLFAILFIIFMFINFNPTFLLFSIFLIVGVLDLKFETKYQKINVFCKKNRNFVKINCVFVNLDTKIEEILKRLETSKTQIFCAILENGKVINLSEDMIINLSMVYPLTTTLRQIL